MSPRAGSSQKLNYDAPSAIGVIYARYSSHNQKEESIEQQIAECEAYARANNIEIINIYADKALTGKTDKRPEFQKMIRHAERRQFQIVIAYKSNRMARNMLQALAYEDKLSKFCIRVVYAKEEFGDTAAGRFALRTMMNVNQFYSENMAEDIKRGLIDNAEKCLVNQRPALGYRKGPDGKHEIDPDRAAVVREIYERFMAGEPFVDIANDLNTRGIKTSQGGKWNKGSFHRMLQNEAYIGVYKYSDVRIEGGMPAIIGKELFYKVQDKLSTKKNPQGRHRENGDYLLTGKLDCGHCKSHMVGITGTSKTSAKHYYYICQKKRLEKSCDKKTVRRDYIEQIVAEDTQKYILQDEVMEWIADQTVACQRRLREKSELTTNEKTLNDVKKAIKNLLAAIEQGIVTASTKDRLMELEAEQARLEAKISGEKIDIPTFSKEQVLFWLDSFRDGDVTDKGYQARLIDAFVTAVYLYDKEIRIVFGYSGKKRRIRHKLPSDADIDAAPEKSECSYKLSSAPPQESQTNPTSGSSGLSISPSIYMVDRFFVLVAPLPSEER